MTVWVDEDSVLAFIADRSGYVRALKASREADADYWRWQGHAEARRQLAEILGVNVPY